MWHSCVWLHTIFQVEFYCFNNMYVLTRPVSELRGFRKPKMSPPTFNHTNLNPVIFTHTKAKHKTLFLYPGSNWNNTPADAGGCVQIYSTHSPSFPFSTPPLQTVNFWFSISIHAYIGQQFLFWDCHYFFFHELRKSSLFRVGSANCSNYLANLLISVGSEWAHNQKARKK